MLRLLKKLFASGVPAGYPHLDDIDVDITVTWDASGDPVYGLEIKDHQYRGGANGKGVKPKANRGCLIHFEIRPGAGNIRFDAAQPIFWAEDGAPYPSGFEANKQLLVKRCDADDLEVIDWNSIAGEIDYQINFTSLSGKKLKPLDPVIINGGGGIKPSL
jgi:hypothetical protein